MTNVGDGLSAIEDETINDTPPNIASPAEGEILQSARITARGGGHARRNIRAVKAGKLEQLSDHFQMDGGGACTLHFLADIPPGEFQFQFLQWEQMPPSYRFSPVRTVYWLPPATFTGPPLGSVTNRRPIFSGRGAAPGGYMEIYQAGNNRVVYAKIAVAPDGTFSGTPTIDVPVGQFIFTGVYSINGKYSPEAADHLIHVQ